MSPHSIDVDSSHSVEFDSTFRHRLIRHASTGSFLDASQRLIRYDVFPSSTMTIDIETADGVAVVDSIIIQHFHIGPLTIKTSVKVISVEQSIERTNLTYETMPGHPERGVASFTLIRTDTGYEFEVETWSKPGRWYTWLGKPVMRYLQQRLTQQALTEFCSKP